MSPGRPIAVARLRRLLLPRPAALAALAALAAAPALPRVASVAAQPSPCAGRTAACADLGGFTAVVTDFRPSIQAPTRLVTVTVRFENRGARPLRLGYVDNSGIATDDQGNRYAVYGSGGVRGMGVIGGSQVDPKFVLGPGERSDARFELAWRPARASDIAGTVFDVALAVREIEALAGNQLRLGREHALSFRGFGATAATMAAEPAATGAAALVPVAAVAPAEPPAAPAPAEAAPAPRRRGLAAVLGAAASVVAAAEASRTAAREAAGEVAAVAPAGAVAAGDRCGGAAHCFDAGPFTAEVVRVVQARTGGQTGDHLLTVHVRFRNAGAAPLVLAYSGTTSLATDEHGNRYHWGRAGTVDGSATGIGVSQGRRPVDPQFALRPGESRTATFAIRRYATGRGELGRTVTYDVAVEELELLAGGQVRSVRQHSLSFPALATGVR